MRQILEFRLTKVEHVRVKHCRYALERIYLVFKHHSTRKVIAVPRELKLIFNSYLGPKGFLKCILFLFENHSRENNTLGYKFFHGFYNYYWDEYPIFIVESLILGKELHYPYDYPKWSLPHYASTRNYRVILIILGKRQA